MKLEKSKKVKMKQSKALKKFLRQLKREKQIEHTTRGIASFIKVSEDMLQDIPSFYDVMRQDAENTVRIKPLLSHDSNRVLGRVVSFDAEKGIATIQLEDGWQKSNA
jgi:hypothetical protein